MTRFLLRSAAISVATSLLGVLILILTWPDPLAVWRDGEWRHILRYIGVVLILLSLLLSLRKRVLKRWGRVPVWLSFHEYATTVGFLLIIYHAFGYAFHALLPWVLMVSMTLCVGSGLFVKWLYIRSTSSRGRVGRPHPALQVRTWRPWHLWFGVTSIVLMFIHAGVAYLYGGY